MATLVDNLEREVLHVLLNVLVVELATDQTLDIEDSSPWVRGVLILSCVFVSVLTMLAPIASDRILLTCVTNETFIIVPSDIRWCDTVTLIIDEDFDFAALHDTDTRVGGSKIDTDDWASDLGVLDWDLVLSLDALSHEHHWREKDE